MKLRIAFLTAESVTEGAFDGGLANYLNRVIKGLHLRNHEIEIFTISLKNETVEHNGMIIHRIKPEAKWYSLIYRFMGKYLSGFRWILLEAYCLNKIFNEKHKKNPFDIVQIPNYRASGLFLVIQNKIPTVTRISSYAKLYNEAYERKRDIDVRLQEWLEEVNIKKSFKCYAPSNYLAEIIFKRSNKNIDVLKPLFFIDISPDQYNHKLYASRLKNKQYIFYFGAVSRLKGIFILNKALEKILDGNQDINFVFAGEDIPYKNESCVKKVLDALEKYGKRIIYFNALQHTELYPILMNSRVVVFPSLVDNIPNTCLEAMAHGCIVVASNGASLDELIKDGESGILFKLGDPVSLAEKILYAWNLPDSERKTISDNAKKAIEKLAPETALKELEDYYVKAVEKWENREI
ncbi:MAG: glycosyltransferase family 4 protein [Candidatus Firestonebacteria bacterium]|nr:glycosyltransferase family 4 protein [Candidatus Firestonebacteria bacterium]